MQTMYMMAGVSIAENALESPEAAKVRRLLNDKLDEMLEEE